MLFSYFSIVLSIQIAAVSLSKKKKKKIPSDHVCPPNGARRIASSFRIGF